MTFQGIVRSSVRCGVVRAAMALGLIGLLVAFVAPARAAVSAKPAPGPMFNGAVWATAYSGDVLYVGGDFTTATVGGRSYARSRLAAVDARSGALLSWAPAADGRVKAIAAAGGAVYIAGQFGTVSGQSRDSLARIDAVSGEVHAFRHTVLGKPYALAIGAGRLFVGGAITAVDGQPRTRLAAFQLDSGALDNNWRPSADDQVETLATAGSRVYVGGKFHKISGVAGFDRLVALSPTSGAVDRAFKANAEYITYSVAVAGSVLYAVHGGPGGRAAAYDLSGRRKWTLTMDGDPQAVAVLDGTVYVGGHFDNVCKSSRTGNQGTCVDGNIKRVKLFAASSQGSILPWTANGNGVAGVLTLAANPALHKLAAGGSFTTINGITQKRFAHFG